MNRERWGEVRRLFERALEQPAAEREAFVRREGAADEELVKEVLRMLAAEDSPGFIEPPDFEPEPAERTDLPRGLGDFELLEEIGRGGMGVVYRARQRSLGRIVAVKVLPLSITTSARQIDRFQREARAAARLDHPNIVTVLTVGAEDGTRYFAMEYVKGRNLAEELKRLREEKGVTDDTTAHLPSSHADTYFRTIAELVRQAADALHYAHQHGIVHRDVKPSNLLLDEEGHLRIVDFGLARDEAQGTITRSGELAGTPHYMSPEQARASRHQVDHRTDVYSLGVVMFELLTLRRPFEGRTSQEIITSILQREAPKIRKLNSRVPRDLEVICTTAMAKTLADRYASAGHFRDDLTRFLNHEAIHARPPSFLQIAGRTALRHRRSVAATIVALAALWAGFAYSGERARRTRIDEHMQVIGAARAEGPLRRLPITRALDLRWRLDELHSEPGIRAAEADEARALERDFDELRTELRQRGVEDLALSRDPSQPEGVRELHRLAGLQTLLRASHLFPDDPALEQLASVESAYPTIRVDSVDEAGNPIGAEVFLREVDLLTSGVGEKHLLGRTPLPPTPVLPGYYRIVVVFDSGGFRELVCNPGPAFMAIELTAHRRVDEASLGADMILIPTVDYTIPEFDGERCLQGRSVHLDSFRVDPTEVSNAQYQAFLEATGQPRPLFWQQWVTDTDAFLQTHGDLPVTGITWSDAVTYAEWSGKRLLTAAEWHRAAGGPDNWPFPYSPDPDALPLGNVQAPDEAAQELSDLWDRYLRLAAPIGSHPEARSPEGLFNMYGNVKELTESIAVVLADETTLVPRPFDRIFLGEAWHAWTRNLRMRNTGYWGIGPHYVAESIGFRCAKSAAP